MSDTEFLRRLARELVDKGKLIEAGFVSYRLTAMNPRAGKTQLEETRMAFFAGAQHLFGSIMGILDDDREPTAEDLRRMDVISDELKIFIAEFERKHGLAGRTQ